MTRIESSKVNIAKSMQQLFEFLSDFNNYKPLMPENVANWESTKDDCSFSVSGMASFGMEISDRISNDKIKIISTPKSPFRFELFFCLESDGDNSIAHVLFEADLNPMIKMMAEKPLANLFEHMVVQLKAHQEQV
jgi:hypothetical protein